MTACEDGTLDPARTRHVRYQDFTTAPLRVLQSVYAQLGFELDPEVEEAMRRYLAERPKDALGTHQYAFSDLRIDLDEERNRFERYQSWFDVRVEG